MAIEDWIVALADAARHQSDLDSDGLVDALMTQGLDRTSAERLVVFVPLALGRVLLDGLSIGFSDTYIVQTELAGGSLEHPLSTVPELEIAYRVAQELHPEQLSALALRSAEVSAVNKALLAGSQPQDLVLSPPVVMWPV